LSNVYVRPAVATDIPSLMQLDHTGVSDYVWQLDLRKESGQVIAGFREVRLPRPVNVDYPHDPMALSDEWVQRSATFTALVGDALVGYTCVLEHSRATTVWITDLVVAMHNRRQGIGISLLNATQDWAMSRGARDIFLEMSSKNYPAIRLALKIGFEFCGYNDHYYATKDVALFFGRSLL